MEQLLLGFFREQLSQFIIGFQKEQVNANLLNGKGSIINVHLNCDLINEKISRILPFIEIEDVHISKLSFHVTSWTNIRKAPVIIDIEDITATVVEPLEYKKNENRRNALRFIPGHYLAATLAKDNRSNQRGAYGLVDRIVDNLAVQIRSLTIQFQSLGKFKTRRKGTWTPPSLKMVLRNLKIGAVNEFGQEASPEDVWNHNQNRQDGNIVVYQKIALEYDFMVEMAENGNRPEYYSLLRGASHEHKVQTQMAKKVRVRDGAIMAVQIDVNLPKIELEIPYNLIPILAHALVGIQYCLGKDRSYEDPLRKSNESYESSKENSSELKKEQNGSNNISQKVLSSVNSQKNAEREAPQSKQEREARTHSSSGSSANIQDSSTGFRENERFVLLFPLGLVIQEKFSFSLSIEHFSVRGTYPLKDDGYVQLTTKGVVTELILPNVAGANSLERGGHAQASISYVFIQEMHCQRTRTIVVAGTPLDNSNSMKQNLDRRDENFPLYVGRAVKNDLKDLRHTFPTQAVGLMLTIEFDKQSSGDPGLLSLQDARFVIEMGLDEFDVFLDCDALSRVLRFALNDEGDGFDQRWQSGNWHDCITKDMLANPNALLNLENYIQNEKETSLNTNQYISSDRFNSTVRITNLKLVLPAMINKHAYSCDIVLKIDGIMLVVSSALPRMFLSGKIGNSINGDDSTMDGAIEFPNDPSDIAYTLGKLNASKDPESTTIDHERSSFRLQATLRGLSVQIVPIIPFYFHKEPQQLFKPTDLTLIFSFEVELPKSEDDNQIQSLVFVSVQFHRIHLNCDFELFFGALITSLHHIEVLKESKRFFDDFKSSMLIPEVNEDSNEDQIDDSCAIPKMPEGRVGQIRNQIKQSRQTGGLSFVCCLQATEFVFRLWRRNVSLASLAQSPSEVVDKRESSILPLVLLFDCSMNEFEFGLEAVLESQQPRMVFKCCLSEFFLRVCDLNAQEKEIRSSVPSSSLHDDMSSPLNGGKKIETDEASVEVILDAPGHDAEDSDAKSHITDEASVEVVLNDSGRAVKSKNINSLVMADTKKGTVDSELDKNSQSNELTSAMANFLSIGRKVRLNTEKGALKERGDCIAVRLEDQGGQSRSWSFSIDVATGAVIDLNPLRLETFILLVLEALQMPIAFGAKSNPNVPQTEDKLYQFCTVGSLIMSLLGGEKDREDKNNISPDSKTSSGSIKDSLFQVLPDNLRLILYRVNFSNILISIPSQVGENSTESLSSNFGIMIHQKSLEGYYSFQEQVNEDILNVFALKGSTWSSIMKIDSLGLSFEVKLMLSIMQQDSSLGVYHDFVPEFAVSCVFSNGMISSSLEQDLTINNLHKIAALFDCFNKYANQCLAVGSHLNRALAIFKHDIGTGGYNSQTKTWDTTCHPATVEFFNCTSSLRSSRDFMDNISKTIVSFVQNQHKKLEEKEKEVEDLRYLVFESEKNRFGSTALASSQAAGWLRMSRSYNIGKRAMVTTTAWPYWAVMYKGLLILYERPDRNNPVEFVSLKGAQVHLISGGGRKARDMKRVFALVESSSEVRFFIAGNDDEYLAWTKKLQDTIASFSKMNSQTNLSDPELYDTPSEQDVINSCLGSNKNLNTDSQSYDSEVINGSERRLGLRLGKAMQAAKVKSQAVVGMRHRQRSDEDASPEYMQAEGGEDQADGAFSGDNSSVKLGGSSVRGLGSRLTQAVQTSKPRNWKRREQLEGKDSPETKQSDDGIGGGEQSLTEKDVQSSRSRQLGSRFTQAVQAAKVKSQAVVERRRQDLPEGKYPPTDANGKDQPTSNKSLSGVTNSSKVNGASRRALQFGSRFVQAAKTKSQAVVDRRRQESEGEHFESPVSVGNNNSVTGTSQKLFSSSLVGRHRGLILNQVVKAAKIVTTPKRHPQLKGPQSSLSITTDTGDTEMLPPPYLLQNEVNNDQTTENSTLKEDTASKVSIPQGITVLENLQIEGHTPNERMPIVGKFSGASQAVRQKEKNAAGKTRQKEQPNVTSENVSKPDDQETEDSIINASFDKNHVETLEIQDKIYEDQSGKEIPMLDVKQDIAATKLERVEEVEESLISPASTKVVMKFAEPYSFSSSDPADNLLIPNPPVVEANIPYETENLTHQKIAKQAENSTISNRSMPIIVDKSAGDSQAANQSREAVAERAHQKEQLEMHSSMTSESEPKSEHSNVNQSCTLDNVEHVDITAMECVMRETQNEENQVQDSIIDTSYDYPRIETLGIRDIEEDNCSVVSDLSESKAEFAGNKILMRDRLGAAVRNVRRGRPLTNGASESTTKSGIFRLRRAADGNQEGIANTAPSSVKLKNIGIAQPLDYSPGQKVSLKKIEGNWFVLVKPIVKCVKNELSEVKTLQTDEEMIKNSLGSEANINIGIESNLKMKTPQPEKNDANADATSKVGNPTVNLIPIEDIESDYLQGNARVDTIGCDSEEKDIFKREDKVTFCIQIFRQDDTSSLRQPIVEVSRMFSEVAVFHAVISECIVRLMHHPLFSETVTIPKTPQDKSANNFFRFSPLDSLRITGNLLSGLLERNVTDADDQAVLNYNAEVVMEFLNSVITCPLPSDALHSLTTFLGINEVKTQVVDQVECDVKDTTMLLYNDVKYKELAQPPAEKMTSDILLLLESCQKELRRAENCGKLAQDYISLTLPENKDLPISSPSAQIYPMLPPPDLQEAMHSALMKIMAERDEAHARLVAAGVLHVHEMELQQKKIDVLKMQLELEKKIVTANSVRGSFFNFDDKLSREKEEKTKKIKEDIQRASEDELMSLCQQLTGEISAKTAAALELIRLKECHNIEKKNKDASVKALTNELARSKQLLMQEQKKREMAEREKEQWKAFYDKLYEAQKHLQEQTN